MKKVIVVLGILIAMLIAGCSGSAVDAQEPVQTGSTSEPAAEQSDSTTQGWQNAAEITQLLFGTFLLEGTDYAVTAEHAAELLPLWKLYRSLLESDITASEEIEAVAKQITQKMSAEQLSRMAAQTFDREQMNAIMEELGIDTFSGAGRGEGSELPDGFTPPEGFQRGQGGGPGGGPGGAGIDPEVMATRQAEMEASGGFQRGFNLPLVEALIELLEQRAG
jgi:hypothetical protein